MPKSKKRLLTSIVVDICLINLAFLAAYHTCKSLGIDLLPSLTQAGKSRGDPATRAFLHNHCRNYYRCSSGRFLGFSALQTGLAIRERSRVSCSHWRNNLRYPCVNACPLCCAFSPHHPILRESSPFVGTVFNGWIL